jgi:hypothetical protein
MSQYIRNSDKADRLKSSILVKTYDIYENVCYQGKSKGFWNSL